MVAAEHSRATLALGNLRLAAKGRAGIHRLRGTRAECTGPALRELVLHWGGGKGQQPCRDTWKAPFLAVKRDSDRLGGGADRQP